MNEIPITLNSNSPCFSCPHGHARMALARLLLAGLIGLPLGCGDEAGHTPIDGDAGADEADAQAFDPNGCEFAFDGVCDEPVNCSLGTDSTDCSEACESRENLHRFAAACAFRDPRQPPPDDSLPSGGDDHHTGDIDRTISVPSGQSWTFLDVERHYRLFVPAAYDPDRAIPLVVMLPGHRVDIYSLADFTQLNRLADLNNCIVAYAEQEWRTDGRWAWWTDWDWEGRLDENPDFQFLRDLIEAVAGDYNIDRRRVFLVGHSRGASMAFIAALEMSTLIAGACIQSGFTEFGYNETLTDWSGRHVPLFFIHGVEDTDVCIDCTSGGTCGTVPGRPCYTSEASDAIVQRLVELGWSRGDNLIYHRLENVAHRWQPQLNQEWWDFLMDHPLPEEEP